MHTYIYDGRKARKLYPKAYIIWGNVGIKQKAGYTKQLMLKNV